MFALIIIFIIVIIAIALVGFIFFCHNKKYCKFLISNSTALINLFKINNNYKFYHIANLDEAYIYDNEKLYDTISCEDYLIYQLQFKMRKVQNQIEFANINKRNYYLYCQEISKIDKLGEYLNPCTTLKQSRLLYYEKKLFEKSKLKPIVDFYIHVRLYCSKINGDIYDSKHEKFYPEHVLSLIKRLNNKNGCFYNDKNIWDALCRVERGRVSNKMRFSIYKRDGYKCKICGRGQTSDYLEIDHIKPIAKGGKSEYSNLQTLCRECNKKKGDIYHKF